MSDMICFELTDRQRNLLMRGLRFVRSSRMFESREASNHTEAERQQSVLREIQDLVELLDQKPV
jgi:hypothetical protein